MNPLMRNMQARQAKTAQQAKTVQQAKEQTRTKKNPRRPPPPSRNRIMSTPQHLQTAPCGPFQPSQPVANVNYDDKLTHLSSLFPNIDNSIIMDILLQKRGNIEAATSDLFQLTNPGSWQSEEHVTPLEFESIELPPCYDELDLAYSIDIEKTPFDEFSSLPPSLNQFKESKMLKKHDLRKQNTSLALPTPPQRKDYLAKWKKDETCWLNVNGKQILIGPLPNDFLRIQRPVQGRSHSVTTPTVVQSPLGYPPKAPTTPGPNEEINQTRDGRISPFRLPLKLEELDIVDPEETENQVFADWKLAHYLQNMEFVSRVEQNRDLFASIRLAADAPDANGSQTPTSIYSQATLKRLDKNTKKKLTKLARKISREELL